MNAKPMGEFPNALRGVQFRAVGRQEVQAETFRLLLPPVSVQSGVVISGVVGNHHHLSSRARAGSTKLFQELPAGQGVELARLGPEEELAVAQANRSILV